MRWPFLTGGRGDFTLNQKPILLTLLSDQLYASIVWEKKISRTSNLVELHNFYIIIISGCPGHPGFFSNCYLAVPWPNLGHYRGSLTHLTLITWVLHMWSKGHWEPLNEVGSLSLAKHQVGFELGTFWSSQCLKPLGHSPPTLNKESPRQPREKIFKCHFSATKRTSKIC